MRVVSLRLSESIRYGARKFAWREGAPINPLISTVIAVKLAALATQDFIAQACGERSVKMDGR